MQYLIQILPKKSRMKPLFIRTNHLCTSRARGCERRYDSNWRAEESFFNQPGQQNVIGAPSRIDAKLPTRWFLAICFSSVATTPSARDIAKCAPIRQHAARIHRQPISGTQCWAALAIPCANSPSAPTIPLPPAAHSHQVPKRDPPGQFCVACYNFPKCDAFQLLAGIVTAPRIISDQSRGTLAGVVRFLPRIRSIIHAPRTTGDVVVHWLLTFSTAACVVSPPRTLSLRQWRFVAVQPPERRQADGPRSRSFRHRKIDETIFRLISRNNSVKKSRVSSNADSSSRSSR